MRLFPNVLMRKMASQPVEQIAGTDLHPAGISEDETFRRDPAIDRGFSEQYLEINREAHQRPAPSFGAPTLIRHIGVWPYPEADPAGVAGARSYEETVAGFSARRRKFFAAINAVLRKLQQKGRFSGAPAEFELDFPTRSTHDRTSTRFKVTKQSSLAFTLWWPDRGEPWPAPDERRSPGSLRVRVHAEAHIDHATISLFIDAGKPWNNDPVVYHSDQATGARRRKIFQAAESIKTIAADRMRPDLLDIDLLPENDLQEDAARLLAARNLLYEEIWQELFADFGVELHDFTERNHKKVGEVFALFHGLVLSTGGYTSGAVVPIDPAASATSGARPFRRFDADGVEPNAVVKAFWPFIRRMTPYADYREFIACGVFDWRALYITALGGANTFSPGDEGGSRLDDAPSGALPELMEGYDPDRAFPVRYLILTKDEPHRRQIGRIVDRVNALGTMRLFVFKDWPVIRQASEHVRLRGLHLDQVMTKWHLKRKYLEAAFDRREYALKRLRKAESYEDVLGYIDAHIETSRRPPGPGDDVAKAPPPIVSHPAIVDDIYEKLELGRMATPDKLMDKKSEVFAELARTIENDLVEIGTALGEIGELCPGGIHYTINRSNYYIKEFTLMRDRLLAGNIETWVSYDQFVDRGLKPSFDFITSTGERLASLRNRLQIITQSIQTSAVFVQASETRRNTQVLKDIAEHWRTTNFLLGLWGIVVVLYNAFVTILPDTPWRWLLFGSAIVLTVGILMTNRSVRRHFRRLRNDLSWWDVVESGTTTTRGG